MGGNGSPKMGKSSKGCVVAMRWPLSGCNGVDYLKSNDICTMNGKVESKVPQ